MSFSNAPDRRVLGRVAGALGVDEAFVEKDWFVVQAIRMLVACGTDDIQPVFSGGTSLLKGHGLINRFSEDIDFKLVLSPAFEELSGNQQSKRLKAFREALAGAWTEQGFILNDVQSRDSYRFIQVEMRYPTVLSGHPSLRPHILAEISAKPPKMTAIVRPLRSFVAQAAKAEEEVAAAPCVDPVETAADKLSALAWRVAARDRNAETDDPTIIRHLHDLAALENAITGSAEFSPLVLNVFQADRQRGGGVLAEMPPPGRLAALRERLGQDALYREEYDRYVAAIAFAGPPEVLSFDLALTALERISTEALATWAY
ncbi:nucleotidyl transferase AbiEii/AbiGii toxin family protein [Sphingomonas sp. CFBP 13706]|uniref:nucleotidyl transferase AbiEii/AbiGii toxin family protein n=1 Tax=Sphingomonas sp. CFBP 13706 TaxID=2775314 RepID=UPI00177E48ED|nr:nucleotidyl transferase AbiEii/AbiGii toxin family protein [Sphingomonas sp. CFBP 13706]MBD8737612.1 nucleotidyl transferase AbiEii/AbiGii toxin family protein [Sphingomonas sp. CFBP 13706]